MVLRPNRRRTNPLAARLPGPREVVDACGRAVRRAAPALATAGVLALVGGGLAFGRHVLTTSRRFAIAEVDVRGSHVLAADEVRALLPVGRGDNLFGAPVHQAETALRSLPWIEDARVYRELPHTLVVELAERTPAALVAADQLYLVDASGRPFKRAALDRGEGRGLPVVSGIARDDYAQDPEAAAARVRQALAVLAAWRAGSRPAIGEIAMDHRGATVFTYDDAVAVRVGTAEGDALGERLARFDAAWAALSPEERGRARTIHVDNQTRTDLVTVSFRTN